MALRDSESWREQPSDPSDREGGWRGAFARLFAPGASFYDWALPLYTAWGIRVRLHVLFILIEGGLLLDAMKDQRLMWAILSPLAVFLLVLPHEYGHCLACRWRGGDADDILLWPLGGLASCRPPHNWKDSLITTLGGPMTHVVLAPVLAGAVLLSGLSANVLLFNPLYQWSALGGESATYWQVAIWVMYCANIKLFLFNMLLPMFPMDAGRVLQELLWRKIGWKRSMAVAVNVGLAVAIVIGVLSAISMATARGSGMLLGLAFFGGMTCWQEKQRLRLMELAGDEPTEFEFNESLRMRPEDDERERRKQEAADRKARLAAERKAEDARREQEEVDRILAKIAAAGLASLTRAEKRTLENATAKKRGGG